MEKRTPPAEWRLYLAEFAGTALLIGVGLSVVIAMSGEGSPVPVWMPAAGLRRLITGFLFGTTGATIALSPIGKLSGAHINPAVTFAFWQMGKLKGRTAIGYVAAQFAGAAAGAMALLLWGPTGRSVSFGATLPGAGYSSLEVLAGEVATTFALVVGLCIFLSLRALRHFTPALFPLLFAGMVYAEAPLSGTSTNPARSFGPALVSGMWNGWWIYIVGPIAGAAAAVVACTRLAERIEVAKLYHFEADPNSLFGGLKPPSG